MQSFPGKSLELEETVEEITVRVTGLARNVAQFVNVTRLNTEGEYRHSDSFQQICSVTRILAVAKAVRHQEHYFLGVWPTVFQNCLQIVYIQV